MKVETTPRHRLVLAGLLTGVSFLVLGTFAAVFLSDREGARESEAALATASRREPSPVAVDATDDSRSSSLASSREGEDLPPNPASYDVAGRVLDERHLPAVGAQVTLWTGGRKAGLATSDERGHFLVNRASLTRSDFSEMLIARDGEGRIARAYLRRQALPRDVPPLAEGVRWYGDLHLVQSVSLSIRVEDENGPVVGAHALLGWQPEGLDDYRRTSDAEGRVDWKELPLGRAWVQAWTEDGRVGAAWVALPVFGKEVHPLLLRVVRDIVTLVSDSLTGHPIEGAEVELVEFQNRALVPRLRVEGVRVVESSPANSDRALPLEPTGLDGKVVMPLRSTPRPFDPTSAYVHITAPGYRPVYELLLDLTSGHDEKEELLVALVPWLPRELRWKLLPVEGAPPIPEGPVKLLPLECSWASGEEPLPDQGTIHADKLVVADVPGQGLKALAVLEDGRVAPLVAFRDTHYYETSFVKPRQVQVRIVGSDGSPASGRKVALKLRKHNWLSYFLEGGETDANGIYRCEVPAATKMEVLLGEGPQPSIHWQVGTVDTTNGDVEFEYQIPAEIEFVVQLLIDGRPGLPASFRLDCNIGGPLRPESKEPETGTLYFKITPVRSRKFIELTLESPDHLRARARLPWTSQGPLRVEMSLVTTGSVAIHARIPADGRWRMDLDRWDEGRQDWVRTKDLFPRHQAAEEREVVLRVDGLRPGRHRVVERESRFPSEPFEVQPGRQIDLYVDFSGVGWIRGTLLLPAGHAVSDVRISVRDDQDEGSARLLRVSRDGTFEFRVSGTRTLWVRAHHPSLTTLREERVRAPRDGLELRLVKGPHAAVRLRSMREGEDRLSIMQSNGVRIVLTASDGTVQECRGLLQSGTLHFSGYQPGWNRLLIDGVPDHAPLRLRPKKLGEGFTDLGEFPMAGGSSLCFAFDDRGKGEYPLVSLNATALFQPGYRRLKQAQGAPRAWLHGLGSGRFEVLVSNVATGRVLFEGVVNVDGRRAFEIPVEIR